MKTKQDYNNNNIPLVSISCITYQHAPYIRQCLDGFLMQKTDFAFEVLIHDDASTDGTEEIIREYEAKYPDIIKPLYEEENQWVKGRRGSKTFNYPRAKGKYIALCEGDDYWTDPLKLQKQVDFLEGNEEYGLVHTKGKVLNQTTGRILKKEFGDANNTYFDFLIKNRIYTLTVLFKRDLLLRYQKEIDASAHNWKMGDYPMWLWFSYNSKIKLIYDCTAIRRLVKGSASNQSNAKNQIDFFNSSVNITNFFINKYPCEPKLVQKIKTNIATQKIKKAVLIQNYDFYLEGIKEKKSINVPINFLEKSYGVILKNKFLDSLLYKLLKYRRNAL